MEVDIPSDMLHEGINAIACTLVPGSANRRVERAVSFLHRPGAAVNPRRPVMPEKPVAPPIPPALSVVLERRGAAPQPAPREKPKPRPVRGNTWVAPVAERRKALEKSRGTLREELTAAAQRQTEILDLIASRGLRPRRPETGKGESAS
jgi:hypothetical protein